MPLAISDVFTDLPAPAWITARAYTTAHGTVKRDRFTGFLTLPNGIPLLGHLLPRSSPLSIKKRSPNGSDAACEATGKIPIAIDGKSGRWAQAKHGNRLRASGQY